MTTATQPNEVTASVDAWLSAFGDALAANDPARAAHGLGPHGLVGVEHVLQFRAERAGQALLPVLRGLTTWAEDNLPR